ncbi:Qat anti-phage system associated protein QatB [Hoeflea alexandrii]
MGTSGKNKGSKRALTPTWVDDPSPTAPPNPQPAAPAPNPPQPGQPSNPTQPPQIPTPPQPPRVLPPLPPATAGEPLIAARSAFSRAASGSGGGGTRQGLGRAASRYVRAMGGSSSASRAMGPSRRAAAGIGQVVGVFAEDGAREALRPFNLENLAGSPVSEVFIALTDVLCPDGGTIDEAIARDAVLETAAELAAGDDIAFDALTPAALEAIFLGTISRSIEAKLFNELGNGAVTLPSDVSAIQTIQNTLHDFIQGKVNDAFSATGRTLSSIPRTEIDRFVTTIYEGAFSLVEAFGDAS